MVKIAFGVIKEADGRDDVALRAFGQRLLGQAYAKTEGLVILSKSLPEVFRWEELEEGDKAELVKKLRIVIH